MDCSCRWIIRPKTFANQFFTILFLCVHSAAYRKRAKSGQAQLWIFWSYLGLYGGGFAAELFHTHRTHLYDFSWENYTFHRFLCHTSNIWSAACKMEEFEKIRKRFLLHWENFACVPWPKKAHKPNGNQFFLFRWPIPSATSNSFCCQSFSKYSMFMFTAHTSRKKCIFRLVRFTCG